MINDGEVVCLVDRTPLNRTDLNCWRCGGTKLDRRKVASLEGASVPYEGTDAGYNPGRDPKGAVAFPGLGVASTRPIPPEWLDKFIFYNGMVFYPGHIGNKSSLTLLTATYYCECFRLLPGSNPFCGWKAKQAQNHHGFEWTAP